MTLRVIVTGAGGFIGNFIAKFLADKGCTVIATTRNSLNISKENIPSLTWLYGDLTKEFDIPNRFDALVHCAAEIPALCLDQEILYRSNLYVAKNMFEKALSVKAKSVIFMSSMSVYGLISEELVTENTIINSPDAYGQSKLDAETILLNCVDRGLYSGLAIRLPGTVGKGSHHNFLSDTLEQILDGKYIYGQNPEALFNNIVYIRDLANFIHTWIVKPRPGYVVTNLSANDPMTIRDILSLIFLLTGQEKRLKFNIGGKKPFLISPDKAKELGYKPLTVRQSVEAFVRESLSS